MAKVPICGNELTEWQERHNCLYYYENKIRKELSTIQESAIYIGYALMDICDQRLYETVVSQSTGDCCKNIFQYAFQELDLSKTTTYNLMAVAEHFSNGFQGLKSEYKNYSFSQLVELLPMSAQERKYADPRMSIKDLRALKKGERVSVVGSDGMLVYFQIPKDLIVEKASKQVVPTSELLAQNNDLNKFGVETKTVVAELPQNTVIVPTSEQKNITNREWLGGLKDKDFIKELFDKFDEFCKSNFDPDLNEWEIETNAKIDLEFWLSKIYSDGNAR